MVQGMVKVSYQYLISYIYLVLEIGLRPPAYYTTIALRKGKKIVRVVMLDTFRHNKRMIMANCIVKQVKH